MRRREFIGMVGGASFWSAVARAQQADMPVVGVLSPQSSGPLMTKRIESFLKGLSEANYVDGQNVRIEYRWAEGRYDRLPALADDLVRRHVTVLVAPTQITALVAKAATSTIPIVFNSGGDPVAFQLVSSLNKPGGNATGISMFTAQLTGKRLGLLHEMAPKVAAVGVLINPTNPNAASQSREMEDAARLMGLVLHVGNASSEREIDAAFENLALAGARALIATADPFFSSQRERLIALASKQRWPAMWEWSEFVEGGGLMSYGSSIVDAYRQVGVYTGRILHGEKPGDLPVVQPIIFELAINLKTAKALGIEVPANLLARADEVID